MLKGDFSLDRVLHTFGHAIAMDQHWLTLYLEAHWRHHGQLDKPAPTRFWHHVPTIVDTAVDWAEEERLDTDARELAA